jgi:hypothetical protein
MRNYSANHNGIEPDNLIRIRGIGAIKKKWLNALGIRTIQDLAGASPEDLDAQLRKAGHSIPRNEIDDWIVQAQNHAIAPSVNNADPLLKGTAPENTERSQAANLASDPANSASDLDDQWQTTASFAIHIQMRQVNEQAEQRTRICHSETNRVETFSGLALDQLQPWILADLSTTEADVADGSALEDVVVPASVKMKITQLRIFPTPRNKPAIVLDPSNRLLSDPIRTGESLAMEVVFQVDHLAGSEHPKQKLSYHTACFARHLVSGETTCLAERVIHVFTNGTPSYSALLPDITLPQPGAYRLKLVVTLQHAPSVSACFKVPQLQVMD